VARRALAPGGKIVWVETTPTGANRYNISNSCVSVYNGIAALLFANKTDVATADLYGAVTGVCGQGFTSCALQNPGDIHFTAGGRQFTAVIVAHAIARELGPKWAVLSQNKTEVVKS